MSDVPRSAFASRGRSAVGGGSGRCSRRSPFSLARASRTRRAPLLQLSEPAFDECLRFGVAVAAAPPDSMFGEPGAEAAAGEGRAIVGAERQRCRLDSTCGDGGVDECRRCLAAAAQLERPANDLTCAAVDRGVHVAPAALGDPDARRAFAIDLVERLRDPLLTTHIAPAAVAFQAGEHDPQLLLRGPTPILALLAQPRLLLG